MVCVCVCADHRCMKMYTQDNNDSHHYKVGCCLFEHRKQYCARQTEKCDCYIV